MSTKGTVCFHCNVGSYIEPKKKLHVILSSNFLTILLLEVIHPHLPRCFVVLIVHVFVLTLDLLWWDSLDGSSVPEAGWWEGP